MVFEDDLMMPQLVIVGAGGHARVLAEIVSLSGQYRLVGFTDPEGDTKRKQVLGPPVLGSDEVLPELLSQGIENAIIGVGSVGDNGARKSLFEKIVDIGFHPAALIHPKTVISPTVQLGRGIAVMANAIINANARLGNNVLVNTGAIVEHDCTIGDHVHVATGARLASAINVGACAHIGVGATVRECVTIGEGAIVGAGAVVVKDVPPHTVVVGVPARILKRGDER